MDVVADMVGGEVSAQESFEMIPELSARIRLKATLIDDGKIVGVIGTITARGGGFPPRERHFVEIIVGQHANQDHVVIESYGHGLVEQRILERAERATCPEIKMLDAGVPLQNVA